jgi:hypothetical protein
MRIQEAKLYFKLSLLKQFSLKTCNGKCSLKLESYYTDVDNFICVCLRNYGIVQISYSFGFYNFC